jgi:SecD/SecF fusion protein
MPASRAIALVVAVAVLAVGGSTAAFILFTKATSDRGLHLLVALDATELQSERIAQLEGEARQRLRDARIAFDGLAVVDGAVQLRIAKPEQVDAALAALRAIGTDVEVGSSDGGNVTLTQPQAGQEERLADAVRSTIEIMRRRFDAAGVAIRRIEPEGQDRIRIHAADPEDALRLRELIVNSGSLSIHEVHPVTTAAQAQTSGIPPGYRVYPMAEAQLPPLLLRATPALRGNELVDAKAGFDAHTSEPIITFRFNASGARKFALLTQSNVGRVLAIVIDGKVHSAPVIREPILGGFGQISGNFTLASAQQLAARLVSGALPAKLTIVEERVVAQHLWQTPFWTCVRQSYGTTAHDPFQGEKVGRTADFVSDV